MGNAGSAANLLRARPRLPYKVIVKDIGYEAHILLRAISDGNWDRVVHICTNDPTCFHLLLSENNDTALHLLVARAPLRVFSSLVPHIPKNQKLKVNSEGNTILHLAASRGDDELLVMVIPLIEEPTIKNGKGETGLYLSGNLQCFELIWENFNYKGRESEPTTLESCISETNDTILHSAIRDGRLELAHFIVDNVPKLIDMKNDKHETPLHILAKHPGFFWGGSAYSNVVKNWSPTSIVVDKAHDLLSKILRFYSTKAVVDKRPNPWKMDRDSIANVNGKSEVNIEKIPSPIVLAMNRDLYDVVKKIVRYFPGVLEDDSGGKRLIFLAVEKRNWRILEFLIKAVQRDSMFLELLEGGNNILHLAGIFYSHKPWERYDSFVQMQLEIKWFKLVQSLVPEKLQYAANHEGKYPDEVFNESHADLVASSAEWIESTSTVGTILVSALTSATIVAFFSYMPGDYKSDDIPTFIENKGFTLYNYFSVISIALGLASMMAFTNARFDCSSKFFSSSSSFHMLLAMILSYAALGGILFTIGLRKNLSENSDQIGFSTSIYFVIVGIFFIYSLIWQLKKYTVLYWSTLTSLEDFGFEFEDFEQAVEGQNIIAKAWTNVCSKLVGRFTNRSYVERELV